MIMKSSMKQLLKKHQGILTNYLTIVKFALLAQEGEKAHFRRLVSLSPAMRQSPPINSFIASQTQYQERKKGSGTLCVEETIEESNYVQGPEPFSLSPLRNISVSHLLATLTLNSTASYPKQSNITSKTKNKKKESSWLLSS